MGNNYEGPSINPRFQVQQPGGPYMRVVWDTWLNVEASRHYGAYAGAPEDPGATAEACSDRAQLLAETRASELNLQSADPLGFISRLALHLSEARRGDENGSNATPAGELLEDVDTILEHYIGRLRGVKTTDLQEGQVYSWAAWMGNV
jgi:hypothetical protein